ncbi:MAG: hypothetical protein QM727_04500 [Niabella sp.]
MASSRYLGLWNEVRANDVGWRIFKYYNGVQEVADMLERPEHDLDYYKTKLCPEN